MEIVKIGWVDSYYKNSNVLSRGSEKRRERANSHIFEWSLRISFVAVISSTVSLRRLIIPYKHISSTTSYIIEDAGNRKPLFLKKVINSFFGLLTREISVPRILVSSIVPLEAILTSPFFAAYPNRMLLLDKDCSLNLLTGSSPGAMCSISSTQLQAQVSNLNKIFS